MSQQIDSYLAKNHKFNHNDLVVLFISTNDFFDITDINDAAFFRKLADEQARQIDRLIQIYNQRLAGNLHNKSEVFLYNIHDFDTRTIENIKEGGLKYTMDNKKYTLKNYTEGCYQNNQGDYQGVAGPVCSEPKTHFFYDRIHTSSGVNYLLAKDIYKKFSATQSSNK